MLGYEIAKSGMNAARYQLNVSAHNLANLSTPGYTRQSAVQVTRTPIHSFGVIDYTGSGIMGQGTTIETIQRVRNDFLDGEYRKYLSSSNYNFHMSQGYTYIENILNEPSDVSISANLSTFWNSLSELGSKPTDMSARATFVQAALSFTTSLNSAGDKIEHLKSQYKQELETSVQKINDLTADIYDLNKKISDMEAIGNPANDLRDTRDLLIDELSKMVDIETYPDESGGVSILAGGKLLVGINTRREVSLVADTANSSYKVIWSEELDQFEMKGGHLKGALDTINESLSSFENSLNNMIVAISDKFNEIHNNGFDLNGDAGVDFFVSSDGKPISIHNITINPDIVKDEGLLALSGDATLSGDNTNLNKLLTVKDEKLLNPSGTTSMSVDEFYNYTVSKIGLNSMSFSQTYKNASGALESIGNEKSAVSGVSLDEETSNVIIYQQAYNASAKVLQTVDEMLTTLINIV